MKALFFMEVPYMVQNIQDRTAQLRTKYIPQTMERAQIERALKEKPWFKNTEREIQNRLLGLPGADDPNNNGNGFLAHLAWRPEIGGGVQIVAMSTLLIPAGRIYGIFSQFKVRKTDNTGLDFFYQYFSWRQGPSSGSKGVIIVRDRDGDISHIVIPRIFSFGVGAEVFDTVGGFAFDEVGIVGLVQRFLTEAQEEIGIDPKHVKRIIPLGLLHLDPGMGPNCPDIFAAEIGEEALATIKAGQYVNPDPYEMKSVPIVLKSESLWGPNGHVMTNTNAYFSACLLRLLALGEMRMPLR